MVQQTQNMLDKTHLRPMADQKSDRLTHVAREKGNTWNSFALKEGERIEAVRGFFDGGVSSACQGAIKNKVGVAYVVQVARKIVKFKR